MCAAIVNNFDSSPKHELMSPTTPVMPEKAANLFAPVDVEMTNGDVELMNGFSSKVFSELFIPCLIVSLFLFLFVSLFVLFCLEVIIFVFQCNLRCLTWFKKSSPTYIYFRWKFRFKTFVFLKIAGALYIITLLIFERSLIRSSVFKTPVIKYRLSNIKVLHKSHSLNAVQESNGGGTLWSYWAPYIQYRKKAHTFVINDILGPKYFIY